MRWLAKHMIALAMGRKWSRSKVMLMNGHEESIFESDNAMERIDFGGHPG